MLRWLKSDLGGKAQFFIISTVIVAVFLASVTSLFRDYSATDLSKVPEIGKGEFFINSKEMVKKTIDGSDVCRERKRNLQELKNFLTREAMKRGVNLEISYEGVCPKPVDVSINLTSSNLLIRDEFQYS